MGKIDDRMVAYEKEFTSQKIDPSLPFVIRLDGHRFSKFTKGTHNPYDYNLHNAFVNTTKLIMKEYDCTIATTHSDEISLLFYPEKNVLTDKWKELIYAGRIQKMISIAASYCTMQFNRCLKEIFKDKKDQYIEQSEDSKEDGKTAAGRFYNRVMDGDAYFDCRIFQMPNEADMFSYLFWRSSIDCRRNHVFKLARMHFSNKQLHGVNVKQMIEKLKEKGVDWEDEPVCFKRGTFFKKMKKEMPKDQEDIIRYEYNTIDLELTKLDDKINAILKCKIYPPMEI